jgi:hypothetical protein
LPATGSRTPARDRAAVPSSTTERSIDVSTNASRASITCAARLVPQHRAVARAHARDEARRTRKPPLANGA